MSWNNGCERRKFEENQKRLAAEYRAAGMNEEQIAEMYRFDLEVFNSDRRYAEHNEQFPESNFEDGGEDNSPLMKRHLDAMSVGIEQSLSLLPDWWIEEIDDPALVKAIKKLSEDDRRLLAMLAIEGYTQSEAASVFGVSQRAIGKRMQMIEKFLRKFLKRF